MSFKNIKIHELLEELVSGNIYSYPMSKESYAETPKKIDQNIESLSEVVAKAKPFYAGMFTEIPAPKDHVREHAKLPYPVTYIEGILPEEEVDVETQKTFVDLWEKFNVPKADIPTKLPQNRSALLCLEDEQLPANLNRDYSIFCGILEGTEILYHVFMFVNETNTQDGWKMHLQGHTVVYSEEKAEIYVLPFNLPGFNNTLIDEMEYFKAYIRFPYMSLNFLQVLNCENVSTIKRKPPQKLNKKRIKKNRVPFSSYEVLKLSNKKSKNSVKFEEKPETYQQRQHWVRGHLHSYHTKSGVIRHFLAPYLKGNPELGSIRKEYSLFYTD